MTANRLDCSNCSQQLFTGCSVRNMMSTHACGKDGSMCWGHMYDSCSSEAHVAFIPWHSCTARSLAQGTRRCMRFASTFYRTCASVNVWTLPRPWTVLVKSFLCRPGRNSAAPQEHQSIRGKEHSWDETISLSSNQFRVCDARIRVNTATHSVLKATGNAVCLAP